MSIEYEGKKEKSTSISVRLHEVIQRLLKRERYFIVFYQGQHVGRIKPNIAGMINYTVGNNKKRCFLNRKQTIKSLEKNNYGYKITLTNFIEINKKDCDIWNEEVDE